MRIFLKIVVLCFILAGCASKIEPPLEEHQKQKTSKAEPYKAFPPILELLTLGFINDKEENIKAARKAADKEKYVSDENDERGFIKKSIGKMTLGLIGGKETKKNREKRLIKEAAHEATLVPVNEDDRSFVDRSLHTLTFGIWGKRETKIEREARLIEEVEKAKDPDKRGVLTKSVEILTLGTFAPGKPEMTYPENVVMENEKLGNLQYGISEYSDVVLILGKPIKIVTQIDGTKEGLFKVYPEKYANLRFIGSPQQNVRLHFDKEGFLVRKENL